VKLSTPVSRPPVAVGHTFIKSGKFPLCTRSLNHYLATCSSWILASVSHLVLRFICKVNLPMLGDKWRCSFCVLQCTDRNLHALAELFVDRHCSVLFRKYGQQFRISLWQRSDHCRSVPCPLTGWNTCHSTWPPASELWTMNLHKFAQLKCSHCRVFFHKLATRISRTALNGTKRAGNIDRFYCNCENTQNHVYAKGFCLPTRQFCATDKNGLQWPLKKTWQTYKNAVSDGNIFSCLVL
jgi:hypothetical protein